MSDSSAVPMSYTDFVRTADHLMAAKLYSLAACVMLFYDITITFGDEVEKIWRKRFTGATILWFINRYANCLGYVVIIVSFHQPWPVEVCNRYILYPEILKTITDTAIGCIFIIRLYAIYSRSRIVLLVFGCLLMAEISTKIWAFTSGVALQLPPGLVGCILTGQPEHRFIWTWVAELLFDSCVFFATVVKAFSVYRTMAGSTASVLFKIVLRDGVMYFATIFVANVITVCFILAAPPDIKAINASFSNMITSLMVSRLMLNLRVDSDQYPQQLQAAHVGQRTSFVADNLEGSQRDVKERTMEETIMGNLGADVSYWADESDERKDNADVPSDDDGIELVARYNYYGNRNSGVESEGCPRQSW